MKLIIGLGNPEQEYDKTRHNIGFMALNHYCDKLFGEKFKKKYNGYMIQTNIRGEKVIFLKPDTYMNLSGEAVIKYMNFFDIELKDILVIYDDLDLNFGTSRIKFKSSAGGHNGVKSMINHLKSQNFVKVKLGILNEYKKNTKNFVLGKFSKSEQSELESIFSKTDAIIDDFIDGKNHIDLMNNYN